MLTSLLHAASSLVSACHPQLARPSRVSRHVGEILGALAFGLLIQLGDYISALGPPEETFENGNQPIEGCLCTKDVGQLIFSSIFFTYHLRVHY